MLKRQHNGCGVYTLPKNPKTNLVLESVALKYHIIYEDEQLIVLNKPNNLLVHHSRYARNIREKSLAQLVRKHVNGKVFPAHRLDRKTSGIIVFAKQKDVAHFIQKQFEGAKVKKRYLALVRGFVEDSGVIDTPIKDEKRRSKEALTSYKLIEQSEVDIAVEPYPTARFSLIELSPKTGRTHQLRKHMNKISHPIIGDTKYGNRHHNRMFDEKFGHSLMYLHAKSIEFEHPNLGAVSYEAPLPSHWLNDLTELGFSENLLEIFDPHRTFR